MNIDRIVVATDFSEESQTALQHATSLARQHDAELLIVHVDEASRFTDTGFAGWPMNAPDESPMEELNKVTPGDPSVKFSRHMLSGLPAEAIAEFAATRNVDLIVTGTHGRTGLYRLLLGSVAEKLVRNCNCPVLTIGMSSRHKVGVD